MTNSPINFQFTQGAANKIKIGVLDNCPVVISGLQAMLGSCSDLEFKGAYTSVPDLVKDLSGSPPDVILTEISSKETKAELVVTFLLKSFTSCRVMVMRRKFKVRNAASLIKLAGEQGFLEMRV